MRNKDLVELKKRLQESKRLINKVTGVNIFEEDETGSDVKDNREFIKVRDELLSGLRILFDTFENYAMFVDDLKGKVDKLIREFRDKDIYNLSADEYTELRRYLWDFAKDSNKMRELLDLAYVPKVEVFGSKKDKALIGELEEVLGVNIPYPKSEYTGKTKQEEIPGTELIPKLSRAFNHLVNHILDSLDTTDKFIRLLKSLDSKEEALEKIDDIRKYVDFLYTSYNKAFATTNGFVRRISYINEITNEKLGGDKEDSVREDKADKEVKFKPIGKYKFERDPEILALVDVE